MRKIVFKNISIKNFLSVGDVPVDVAFRQGLHIITGVNKDRQDRRNGVGKSTIADAINFALYGETIRELKKEHIVNNITKSNCEVILSFQVIDTGSVIEYKIVRKLNPSKCFLYQDDKDVTRDSIANTTSFIVNIIGSSADVFQNCVIMTLNNTTPFMAKKKLDKRKFIEGILNLEVFSNMLNTVRGEYNEITREFDVECMRYEEVSRLIDSLDQQLVEHKRAVLDGKNKLKDRLKENNRNIARALEMKKNDQLEVDIDKLKAELVDYKSKRSTCNNTVVDLKQKQSRLRAHLELKQQELQKINSKKDVCPTCKRPHEEETQQLLESARLELENSTSKISEELNLLGIEKWEAACDKLQDRVDSLVRDIRELDSQAAEYKSIDSTIKQLETWNSQIIKDLESTDDVEISVNNKIDETTSRLNLIQDNIKEIKQRLSVLEVVKYVVSEEGVKSYVVKKILQVLNNKLAYYLQQMEANCVCVFDEYFEEQIFDEKGQLCSYFNFSGAERKNIDLACLFAFMDIRRLQGDVTYNLNIYDELLDSSLDEQGSYIILNILKERVEKYNEMCYIITHRKEGALLARGDTIMLQKQKGITTRVDNLD